jgi:hypothetical protein
VLVVTGVVGGPCTDHPPYEQVLVGVGYRPPSLSCRVVSPRPSSCCPFPRSPPPRRLRRFRTPFRWSVVRRRLEPLHPSRGRSTRDPPPEQLLVGLGAGGASSVTVGGRGARRWRRCRLLAPMIHPASSCSQSWRWGLCGWLPLGAVSRIDGPRG